MGNLDMSIYNDSIGRMNEEDAASVNAGNYPIIVIADGAEPVKLHITLEQHSNYSNINATEAFKNEQWDKFGYAVPIVWEAALGGEAPNTPRD
jgi:hypothetical protein